MKTKVMISCLIFTLCACATNSKSRLTSMGIGFATGAVVGASTAPKNESSEQHALYWGGILGLIAGVASNYYFNDQRDMEFTKLENDKLKAQLDFFQNGPSTLLKESKTSNSKIKLYKIDQWTEDGPNKRYHRDQMMEIIPLPEGRK